MTTRSIFSERLKECRKLAGMSQRELAKAIDTSKTSVCKWEQGKSLPRGRKFLNVAKALGVEPERLCSPEPITQIKLTEEAPPSGATRTRYRNAVRSTLDDLSAIIGDSKATMIAVEYVVARLEIRLFDN